MNMMDTPNGIGKGASRSDNFIRSGIHLFYSRFIEPRSQDEDRRRTELILNTVLTALIFLLALLDLSILFASNDQGSGYDGIPFLAFTSLLGLFICIRALSRKGFLRLASYLVIFIYFCGTTYGAYIWGMSLPAGLLSYALIITMATMLLGARFGALASAAIVAVILTLAYFESASALIPAWKTEPTLFINGIQYSIFLLSITALSWIYWKDLQRSLARARKSEEELQEKNESLEAIVEERTMELRRSQAEQISQLYRFAEFGKIASGVFHDLINPLSAVALNVYYLQDKQDGGYQNSKEHIDKAVRASKRMERFLASVKKQITADNKNSEFSMNESVEESIMLIGHKANQANAAIEFEADRNIVTFGNPFKFEQIVSNLVSNAIDACEGVKPRNGVQHVISVKLGRSKGIATLTVADAGCGIAGENKDRIFDAFFTTKQGGKGMGIGLSTIKDIVEKEFGGSISVRSKEGTGSTFTALIPIHAQEHTRDEPEQPEKAPR